LPFAGTACENKKGCRCAWGGFGFMS
jgi:hypothetical protein